MLPSEMVRFQSLLSFRVDGQKTIQKRNVWTRISLKTQEKFFILKQKRRHVDEALSSLSRSNFSTSTVNQINEAKFYYATFYKYLIAF